jgi:hypothetical protein
MRHAFIGLCILSAACSGRSPTLPSGLAGVEARPQTSDGTRSVGPSRNGSFEIASSAAPMDPVEVTFTKWITAYPAMAGVTGGDAAGTFAGAVLRRDPFENGTIVQLEARYGVIAADPAHSFVAMIEGKLNNTTSHAVLNGTVASGWLAGARVQVTFDVIVPAPGTSCVPTAPADSTCFQGTIRILPGSAN